MPVGHQDDFWGVSESIQGQLGSVCVFNDGIHEQHGYMLNSVGRFVVVWCNCIDTWCSQCVAEACPRMGMGLGVAKIDFFEKISYVIDS